MNNKVYEEKLKKEKAEIEAELKKVPEVPNLGDDTEGELFEQEADEAEEYVTNLGVKQTWKERLADIESALERIQKGTYGKCEKCNMEISEKVLNVNPESRHCEECNKQVS